MANPKTKLRPRSMDEDEIARDTRYRRRAKEQRVAEAIHSERFARQVVINHLQSIGLSNNITRKRPNLAVGKHARKLPRPFFAPRLMDDGYHDRLARRRARP